MKNSFNMRSGKLRIVSQIARMTIFVFKYITDQACSQEFLRAGKVSAN